MNRRQFLQQSAILGLAAGTTACAGRALRLAEKNVNILYSSRYLPKLDITLDRVVKETVGLRPYRTLGPRIEKEPLGEYKTLVHNYGHGGSGWSLSWGSADLVADLVATTQERHIAVIGCGVIGLTTALTLQRRGYAVTIYTKEMAPDITSSKATGTWSPAHRLIDQGKETPTFYEQFKRAHNYSFRQYQNMLGLGDYVVWTDSYDIRQEKPLNLQEHWEERDSRFDFMKVMPAPVILKKKEHPFRAPAVIKHTTLVFNIPSLLKMYTDDFLRFGGKIKIQEFKSLENMDALPQRCIVNCTGIGAKALTQDECLLPIAGQLAFVIPQHYVHYRINTGETYTINRKDGIVVGGTHTVGSWDTTPKREDTERMVLAIKKVADEMYT